MITCFLLFVLKIGKNCWPGIKTMKKDRFMRESLVKWDLICITEEWLTPVNSLEKMKHVPYPSPPEEERAHATCCRNCVFKGSEGWVKLAAPLPRALVTRETSLQNHPHWVLRPQTQRVRHSFPTITPVPPSGLLCCSHLAPLFSQVRQALNLWIISAFWSLCIFLLLGHVAYLPLNYNNFRLWSPFRHILGWSENSLGTVWGPSFQSHFIQS